MSRSSELACRWGRWGNSAAVARKLKVGDVKQIRDEAGTSWGRSRRRRSRQGLQ